MKILRCPKCNSIDITLKMIESHMPFLCRHCNHDWEQPTQWYLDGWEEMKVKYNL